MIMNRWYVNAFFSIIILCQNFTQHPCASMGRKKMTLGVFADVGQICYYILIDIPSSEAILQFDMSVSDLHLGKNENLSSAKCKKNYVNFWFRFRLLFQCVYSWLFLLRYLWMLSSLLFLFFKAKFSFTKVLNFW